MTRLAMVESLFYFARLVTLRHYDRLSFTGREYKARLSTISSEGAWKGELTRVFSISCYKNSYFSLFSHQGI